MIKNLLSPFFFAILCMGNLAAQVTPINIFVGTTNNMNVEWTNACSATVTTSGEPFEGNTHFFIDYASTGWFAGGEIIVNGGFPSQNWTQHTHFRIAWKGTADRPNNELMMFFKDFETPQESGNEVIIAPNSNSSTYTERFIPLSDFDNGDLNMANIYKIWFQVLVPESADGVTNGQYYIDAIQILDLSSPTISGFSPSAAQPGQTVTITGTKFLHASEVLFGGEPAEFTIINSETIEATVPDDATNGVITVSNPVESTDSEDEFEVLIASGAKSQHTFATSIGPNPSSGIFNINTTEQIDAVIVTDYLGNVVSNNAGAQLDLSSKPDGIYFVTVISGQKKSSSKIIKK